jgi:8-hydroxy-5-deazaflavin:NADPH oxidoreductase
MKIAVAGRGNVGGGLADLWERAGHEVRRIGREGGDVSEAETVLVAVPGGTIAETLDNVQGIKGKTVIDATNPVGVDPPAGFSSNAEFVKSRTNGPTAKSFNTNFAALYDRIGEARSTPSNLRCGDEKARQVVEQLNRDAGYEPVYAGPLENAALQEDFLKLVFAINQGGWADSSIGWLLPINSKSTVSRSRSALARTSSPSRCSRDASQAESRYALSIEELSPEPLISYEPLAPAERCQLQLLGLFAGHLPP